MGRFECHAHSMFSNIRLLDCINKPKDLVDRAIELNLVGLCITDHEALGGHVQFDKLRQYAKDKKNGFKIGLGNEIYLVDERQPKQPYYHFILIAKDSIGHKMLRELSSIAWINSYFDRGMERVPTLKSELQDIINKYGKGHLIGSTACFRKGTQVLTDKGYANIENITSKDKILNKYGEWELVNFPTQREYDGVGYKINFLEFENSITCTENHKFLVSTNNWLKRVQKEKIEWVKAKDLKITKGSNKHFCLFPIQKIKYTNLKQINFEPLRYTLSPKNSNAKRTIQIKDKINITPELMRLFGLFLGDGSISINQEKNYYAINFTFNEEEFDWYWEDFVKKASDTIGITWSINKRPEHHRVDITSHSIDLVELFYSLFGNNKTNTKFFPECLLNISKDLTYELIYGYILADGYTRVRNTHGYMSGELVTASISDQLSKGVQNILTQLGIRGSIYSQKEKTDKNGVHHQKSWYYTSSNSAWGQINKKSYTSHQQVIDIFEKAQQHCKNKYITINNILYKKVYIKNIEQIKMNETVYCLNVPSHSFVVENVIVHNCLGSFTDQMILKMVKAETVGDIETKREAYENIVEFITFCKELFEDDFYLEVQPAKSKDQLTVNKRMPALANYFNIKMIVTTDAHYLKKEDRYIHKAYLNSKQGDREVDEFYSAAYLQSTEEVVKNLEGTGLDYYELEKNTLEIYNKIEEYTLFHKQQVPEVEVPIYPVSEKDHHFFDENKYPTLDYLMHSQNPQERYWINYCINALNEKNLWNEVYLNRLEEEADTKKQVGEALETCIFSYPIFLQHYINMFWEVGSTVGVARGSAAGGLNHYLLGLTQLDPIKENIPWWRYLNISRVDSLPDIDIDICPSKREEIFEKIREERGQLGCVQVCTYGTETTRSAIATACRGYRSNEYPDGIDVDIAQYMTSLAPSERGFVWPIHDLVYGNGEKGRTPVKTFINEVNKYPGLLDIIIGIEGLINHRGIHASGVNFYGEDPYENDCFMKATNGALITQYSLHDSEYCGSVKYDFLVTEIQDVIVQCLNMLQEHGEIEKNLTLRQVYNKYIHPDVLPVKDDKIWNSLISGKVQKCFQFDSMVGSQTVKTLKPQTPKEMATCNSVMRLMAQEKGGETPSARYRRMKNDISQWYTEMDSYGLTKEEQRLLEKYCLDSYGTPSQQEDMMTIVMDPNICNFSLSESNELRKVCAKKQMNRIPEMKEKILNRASSPALGRYVWEVIINIQLGYSFSYPHALAYSYVGLQTVYLATYFNPVYWNTACLRVDAGLEEEASTNYNKIAKAVGNTMHRGIKMSLIDINKSGYMFEPDLENNTILYGMKGLTNINGDTIQEIEENRPYAGLADFQDKVKANKRIMISLIKSGAFDQFNNRESIMQEYIWTQCEPKKRITLQNFNGLMERNLIPDSLEFEKRLFIFNKALRKNCKYKTYYIVQDNYYDFYKQFYDIDLLEPIDEYIGIPQKIWQKLYTKGMDKARAYFKEHQQELLDALNNTLFQEMWNKYAQGSLADWEMDSLGFYYHDHPLLDINKQFYNIKEYNKLPEEPEIAKTFRRGNSIFNIYKTCRIIGTVIAKDDTKRCINLLTPESGVVTVKMGNDYYARLNRQISELGLDGVKHVIEKSWFTRGTKLMVNGFRRSGMFFLKSYKNENSHQCYKIVQINRDGTIETKWRRHGEDN